MLANSNTPLSTSLPDKEIDLLHLVVTLLSHWKQIVALSLLSGLMALLFAMTAAPQYQADVLIQVEKIQNGLLPGGLDSLMPELSTGTASETELLRSRMILGKTVRDAGLQTVVNPVYFPVVGHAWARLTNNMVKLPTIHQYITTDPAPWVLQVVDSKHYTLTKGTTRLEGKVGQPLQDGGLSLEISALNAPAGSRFTLSRLTEQEAIQELKKNMTIGASKGDSGMIDLTMKGVSPVAIAQTLNIIAENYLQQNVARQTDKEAKSLAFLQELLAEVRTNLTEAENKLNGYRQRNDSIDLSLETKAILEQVAGVDSQLNMLTFEEAELSQLYKKEHPTYRALAEKRRTLEKEKRKLDQRVSEMPSVQQEIFRLSQEVESGREVYIQLLTRQQELSITRSGVTGNVRIIDTATVPVVPIGPKKTLIVVLGLLMGALFSCGLVLLRRMLKQTVDTTEQLEDLGLQVCAAVPHSGWLERRSRRSIRALWPSGQQTAQGPRPFLCLANPADLSVEAIRGLRTSLYFEMQERNNNLLMVCSATENSGKTFLSTSLAALMAETGQKVLFIDADLRRGDAHTLFKMDRGEGLSALLSGTHEVQDIVRCFPAGGFDVITRGMHKQDPSQLLVESRFAQIVAWAKAHYDVVIIDTPPVLAVSDAAIIGKQQCLTLLVARAGQTSLKETALSVQKLATHGVDISGVVLNGVRQNKVSDYCYGYRSGGYHYTSQDECA